MRLYQVPFHVTGTLAANLSIVWVAPFDCQLVHVSAVGSMPITVFSISAQPARRRRMSRIRTLATPMFRRLSRGTGFVGEQFPHIVKDTVIAVALDYDGAGGTAAANFTLVLTFEVG